MVKRREIWLFGALMLVYFLVRWALIFGEDGILRFYLTDLIFVPAMCSFGLIGVRYFKNDPEIRLSWWIILVQVVLVSIYFEMYLPNQDNSYTADPIDALLYFVGGVLFWLIQKRL